MTASAVAGWGQVFHSIVPVPVSVPEPAERSGQEAAEAVQLAFEACPILRRPGLQQREQAFDAGTQDVVDVEQLAVCAPGEEVSPQRVLHRPADVERCSGMMRAGVVDVRRAQGNDHVWAPRKTSSRPLLVKLQRPESCCCLQR